MIDRNPTDRPSSRPVPHRAMRRVFERMREGVFVVDAISGHIVDANPAACTAVTRDRDEVIGRPWNRLVTRLGEASVCDVDGRFFIAIVDAASEPQPTTSRVPLDALTGLATREVLHTSSAAVAERNPPPGPALFFIDLDGFKQVNDTCGHLAGDHVLKIVARRLVESVRPRDLVVRYGGDEFIVVVDAMGRLRDVDRLARRISRTLRRPISLSKHTVMLSASIGIAKRNGVEATIDDLIAKADHAMYRRKREHRDSGTLIDPAGPNSYFPR